MRNSLLDPFLIIECFDGTRHLDVNFEMFFFSFYGFLSTHVRAAHLHNLTKTVTINGICRKINDWTDGWYHSSISDHVNTCGTML